jgi:hypothetical protein
MEISSICSFRLLVPPRHHDNTGNCKEVGLMCEDRRLFRAGSGFGDVEG